MKTKILGIALIAVFALSMLAIAPVAAAKPATNFAGAVKVPWHLSGAVMPVPPYGSLDIPGSDVASKLIVNQPNGAVGMVLEGVMRGLAPNTEYTVYISPGWSYVQSGWDVSGDWVIAVNDGAYVHDYTFTMSWNDNHFTGVGNYPSTGPIVFDEVVINGVITGNTITFTAVYYDPITHLATGYSWTGTGTINPSGILIAGTGTGGVVEWHSTIGQATPVFKGTGWPGMFDSLSTFTFTTNAEGNGNWHLNIGADVFGTRSNLPMSVWINGGGATILVSSTFWYHPANGIILPP